MSSARKNLVLDFSQVDKDDVGLVGGKGANLGEMAQNGFPVPPGFIVTAQAYYYFLKENQLDDKLKKELYLLDHKDPENLQRITERIRRHLISAPVPKDLAKEIIKAYEKLGGKLKQAQVAIRSSATAEDLPEASFAGQQETFLNVSGEASLVEHIREAWSSLFTPRATFYRAEKGFDHLKVGIAVPVQKMIQSEVSGVMFTINPAKNDKSKIVIEAILGLGELIVQGAVTPDHYEIDKQSFEITKKEMGTQKIQLTKEKNSTKRRDVPKDKQAKQKLPDDQIIKLAKLGKKLHQHYFFPQDIEWAMADNQLYILQTRPVTTMKSVAGKQKQASKDKQNLGLPEITRGKGASPGLVSGKAQIVKTVAEIGKVDQGEILVTEMTTPDFVPAMRRVAAIVTNEGGLTSHAAIVSRELGVPCVVGTGEATLKIKTGQMLTVDGTKGIVYSGELSPRSKTIQAKKKKKRQQKKEAARSLKTATKVYVNLAEPDMAKEVAKEKVDGVGLLRAEFMVAQIGIHPKRLISQNKQEVFVEKLTTGLLTFAKAFSPRPVLYRTNDFKTNEYRNLVGGKEYEPEEANPMIGFRGAYRYLVQPDVFELELEAIKRVRNKHGLRNLHVMLPFVRTIRELKEAKKVLAVNGLMRSPSFKLFMMVEVPSNVILLSKFIKVGIDGVSIGSNDLTQLVLGVDRDGEEVAAEFDEQDPAVLWAMRRTIKLANKHHIHCSICGQAPSLYPDLTEKLVKWGISAISVSPDVISQTRQAIYDAEHKLITKRK